MGVREAIDPTKLAEAGWGVIFAGHSPQPIKDALGALLNLRQQQAGEFFRIYDGAEGYQPGELKSRFLARHGVGPGPADPGKMPYYLLIVGSPEAIPYRFQIQLDVQYAVGRIDFGDDLEAYMRYAQSVVAAENGRAHLPRRAVFFAVKNPEELHTRLATEHLVKPLARQMAEAAPQWEIETVIGEGATKAFLLEFLGGPKVPAVLFTASHGLTFPAGHPRQQTEQGAILCSDWPGPFTRGGEIPQEFYVAAQDIGQAAKPFGLITFHFASFSAGTLQHAQDAKRILGERIVIAPEPFVANLPASLLSHSEGGALAVIGYVDTVWSNFLEAKAGIREGVHVFKHAITSLLQGNPVGLALEYFNERYAKLATVLSDELEEIEFGKTADPYELSGLWTENNDARSLVIVGDPAVRVSQG